MKLVGWGNRKTTYFVVAGAAAVLIGLLVLFLWHAVSDEDDRSPLDTSHSDQEINDTGHMAQAIHDVYTVNKELALTFNGMADQDRMMRLLDELDKYHMKASFFLPGMRVAEEPDVAQMILNRGHEIENNTLDQSDMSLMSYEQIYQDIQLANDVIERETGVRPKYVRTRSGDYQEEIQLAADALEMEAVVSYTINPKDRDMQSAVEIAAYVEKYMQRGAIITLNTDVNPEIVGSIAYIADAASRRGYSFVSLEELIDSGAVRKPLEQIPGYDAARINPNYANAEYELFDNLVSGRNEIALTFDDWGSDATINTILDILDRYGVKATFFPVAQGLQNNPNMARAIVEAGHEVANHTFSHPVVTTLTPEQLQEEVVKAHQILTEAIQQQPLMMFRPPTGEIDQETAEIVAATGYQTIAMFDVTALDWDASHSAEEIKSTILDQTVDGSVILLHLHDGIHTIEALPGLIEGLQGRGYSFVKLTELMEHAEEFESKLSEDGNGEMSRAIKDVYTTRKQLSLTFNGMADMKTMTSLLNRLDKHGIKATFFLPRLRVEKEPDIAKAIADHGHKIESSVPLPLDSSRKEWNKEIYLTHQMIQEKTGLEPKYVRTSSGEYTDDLRLAAAHNGMEAVIGASLFLHNWQGESELEKRHYIRKYMNRGGIIAIDIEENTDLIDNIDLIAQSADSAGYQFVSLEKLMEGGGERIPLESIPGYAAAQYAPTVTEAVYNLVNKVDTDKKEVALTFDDWGSDETVTKILNILQQYNVKASFFLRADGVEKNPNLARAIAELGHDVGNHTYAHPIVTELTAKQLQEEIIKAHQIIAEAIQQQPDMMFRPPTGELNEETLHVIAATGYKDIVNFDVIPSDHERNRSAEEIVQTIMEQTTNGSIILLHLLDDTQTVEALPDIIEGLRAKGYSIKPVSEMIGISSYGD
ncbi:polysaccharide deacetylase family protein [Marinicrinis lubricantis]|uniref:Polysaccharide deacetylase family protein n=1 Tax=Marinicrinis lubricantis TaxID=2086470 RepID=A0ABW1ISP4_9BACL